MHEHSDKIQPKKVAITVALLILLLGYAWYSRTNSPEKAGISNTASTTVQTDVKVYTLSEVSVHNTETDCWMAIEGKVYDVTKFIPGHPGGKAILNGCGKDATVLFNERPINDRGPHPASARSLLSKYYIGDLR